MQYPYCMSKKKGENDMGSAFTDWLVIGATLAAIAGAILVLANGHLL